MTSTAENTAKSPSLVDAAPIDSQADELPTTRPEKVVLESAEQVKLAVDAALGRKAEELIVLDLAKVSDFTDHFMICSGSNERQVQAIADAVLFDLRSHGVRPMHVEGLNLGRWVLLDFGGDLVIHVFLNETRAFYDLERLWSDAPVVTSRFVTEPAKPAI